MYGTAVAVGREDDDVDEVTIEREEDLLVLESALEVVDGRSDFVDECVDEDNGLVEDFVDEDRDAALAEDSEAQYAAVAAAEAAAPASGGATSTDVEFQSAIGETQ